MAQIPSGGAPLYLGDLATPMNAVNQRVIGMMLDREARKQEQISKGQKEFLENLDFSTTEGLSDKMSERFLRKQQEMEDRWADEYLQHDMSLPLEKQLEMKRAKRNYETEVANAKLDITRYANAQQKLADPNAIYQYDLNQSHKDLARARKAIDNGERVNWEILHPVPNVSGLVRELTSGFGDIKPAVVDTYYSPEGDKKFERETNVPELQRQRQIIENDPRVQQIKENAQLWGMFQSQLDAAQNAAKVDREVPSLVSPSQRKAMQQLNQSLTPQEQELEQKYNLSERGVDKKYWGNVATLNNITTGLLEGDTEAIEDAKGTYNPDLGRIDRVIYTDDEIVFVGTKEDEGTQTGKKEARIPVPNPNNPAEVNLAKQKLASEVRPSIMKNESNLPTDKSSMFFSDWEYEIRGDKVRNSYYYQLKEGLREDKLNKTDVKALMNQLLGEDSTKAKDNKAFWGLIEWQDEKVVWTNKDGNKRKYNIETKEGKQKLINDIEKEKGYPLTDFGKDTEGESTPVEKDKYVSEQSALGKEMIEVFIRDNNVSREDAVQILKDAGRIK